MESYFEYVFEEDTIYFSIDCEEPTKTEYAEQYDEDSAELFH